MTCRFFTDADLEEQAKVADCREIDWLAVGDKHYMPCGDNQYDNGVEILVRTDAERKFARVQHTNKMNFERRHICYKDYNHMNGHKCRCGDRRKAV